MKFNNQAKIFDLEDGVTMLVYVEHDGDNSKIHSIVWPDEIGTIDNTVEMGVDIVDFIVEKMSKSTAQKFYNDRLKDLIQTLHNEISDDSSIGI